jgi:hypothetical protein
MLLLLLHGLLQMTLLMSLNTDHALERLTEPLSIVYRIDEPAERTAKGNRETPRSN